MVREFADALTEVLDSKEYETFSKDYPSYHLAHGFIQLDKNFNQTKEWQIGFYSKNNDNLAVFETNPLKQNEFEEAFKDGGHIDELQNPLNFISTDEAIKKVKEILNEKHSHEIPNSFLVILQVIKGIPVYNITAITIAFSMISIHIDANTGEIAKENKASVMDLKKKE